MPEVCEGVGVRRIIVTGCLIALSVAASACQRAPAPPPRKILRIIVFPGFARVATSLARALKTARERVANRCAVLGRRAHSSNVRRSVSVSSRSL